MTPRQRTDRLREIELQMRALEAEVVCLVEHNDREREYRSDGHRSTVGYLRAHVNCSGAAIVRRRRCGRLVADHPEVGAALHSGRIGIDQVAELARAHANPRCGHQLGRSLHLLLDHAQRLKFDEFRIVVRRWELMADLDGAHEDHGDAVRSRRATLAAGSHGIDLGATGGSALQASQMLAILDTFIDAEFRADREEARDRLGDDVAESDLRRTGAQRAFDALEKIFHTANNSTLDDTPPAATIDVVIDQYTFEHHLARHGLAAEPTDLLAPNEATARCHTATGVPVVPDEAVAAALMGHVRRVVVDSRGVRIDLGERSRLFTGSAAEAARLFATMCEFPGCAIPAAWCQIDHLVGWEDHGRTEQANAAIACGHQNREKHRHRWRARRDRHGRVQVQRADGSWIVPVGADPPTDADFLTPEARGREIASDLLRSGFGHWTVLTRAA